MTKSNFCESHLEEAALERFEELGYETIYSLIKQYKWFDVCQKRRSK